VEDVVESCGSEFDQDLLQVSMVFHTDVVIGFGTRNLQPLAWSYSLGINEGGDVFVIIREIGASAGY